MKLHSLIDRLQSLSQKVGNPDVIVFDPTMMGSGENTTAWTPDFGVGTTQAATKGGELNDVVIIVPRPGLLGMEEELRKALSDV